MARYPDDGLDDEDERPFDEAADDAGELCGHGFRHPCPVCDRIAEDPHGCIDPIHCCCPHPFHGQDECSFPEDYEP